MRTRPRARHRGEDLTMRTDIAIAAVDRNGMPFDVWLTGDDCTLRDKEGATYMRFEESDDPDGLGRLRGLLLWPSGAIPAHAAALGSDHPRPLAAREASPTRAVRAAERV